MWLMSVTLEVLKLRGWLKDDAPCRVQRRAHKVRGDRCGPRGRRGGSAATRATCKRERAGSRGYTRGAHVEHAPHGCDAGRVPARDVRVDTLQVIEEIAHVSDGRDVPIGDGAVLCSCGCRVSIKGLDRRLQLGNAREGVGWRRGGHHRRAHILLPRDLARHHESRCRAGEREGEDDARHVVVSDGATRHGVRWSSSDKGLSSARSRAGWRARL